MAYASKLEILITAGSQRYAKPGDVPNAGQLTDILTGEPASLTDKGDNIYEFSQINVFPIESYEHACFFMIEHEQYIPNILSIAVMDDD